VCDEIFHKILTFSRVGNMYVKKLICKRKINPRNRADENLYFKKNQGQMIIQVIDITSEFTA